MLLKKKKTNEKQKTNSFSLILEERKSRKGKKGKKEGRAVWIK